MVKSLFVGFFFSVALTPTLQGQTNYYNNAIFSCTDYLTDMGPGTDPVLESPEAIANMMGRWKSRGFTGVYWRVSQLQNDPNLIMYFDEGHEINPNTAWLAARKKSVIEQYPNILQIAQEKANEVGLEFWAWYPTVYSRGAPPTGPGTNSRWSNQDVYMYENPEAMLISRDGKTRYMLSEYAYPAARSSKIAEFEYFAAEYGIKRFIVCMRTEDYQNQDPPSDADEYGFNEIIVQKMQDIYDVDILTDERFDVFSDEFDRHDSMVEKWRELRGGYLTQFYRELRQALHAIDPVIKIAVQLPLGDYLGPTIGNIKVQWRTWIDEGLIDKIIIPICLSDWFETDPAGKGYLTSVRGNIGRYSSEEIKQYISSSPNPQIRLIYAGGARFDFQPPPAYTDGWRTDISRDAYNLAWYQRWHRHLNRDIEDFGHIKFIEQNFDSFTPYEIGMSGGWGDRQYDPNLRSGQGFWYTFGNGSDAKPVVQNEVRRGNTGNAVKLTRASEGSSHNLYGRRLSLIRAAERSRIDNAISNGTAVFEFWLKRKDSSSSIRCGLVYDQAPSENPVRMMVSTGNNGAIYYHNNVVLVNSEQVVGIGYWQKFSFKLDLEESTYSIYMGWNSDFVICENISYTMTTNAFNQVLFSPQAPSGNVTYLDDVSLRWYPAELYSSKAEHIFLADGFENHTAGETVVNREPDIGKNWVINSAQMNAFTIENTLSFGEGVNSLVARRIGSTYLQSNPSSAIPLNQGSIVTLDFDITIRPDAAIAVVLRKPESSDPTAGILASNNKWYSWDNNSYQDTGQTYLIEQGWCMWYHVQLKLNCDSQTYKIVLRPRGEMPKIIASGLWSGDTDIGDELMIEIAPQGDDNTIAYLDNIEVSYGQVRDRHPIPDLTGDGKIDIEDIMIFSQNWLVGDRWE